MGKTRKLIAALLAAILTLTLLLTAATFAANDSPVDSVIPVDISDIPTEWFIPEPGQEFGDEDGIVTPLSLLPITASTTSLDLTNKTRDELEKMPVSEMLALMGITPADGDKIAWGSIRDSDVYEVVESTDTIDMRSPYSSSTDYNFSIIIGKGQIDTGATRYTVDVEVPTVTTPPELPSWDCFTPSMYTDDNIREKVYPLNSMTRSISMSNNVWTYSMPIPTNYPLTEEYSLGLYWYSNYYKNLFPNTSITIYEGHVALDEIGDATEATGLWAEDISSSGGYLDVYNDTARKAFTLLFAEGGTPLAVQPIAFSAYPMTSASLLNYSLFSSTGSGYRGIISTSTNEIAANASDVYNILKFEYTDSATGAADNTKITRVMIGQTDITEAVKDAGYTIADRTKTTLVTIVAEETTYTVRIPAVSVTPATQSEAYQYQPIGSSDVYFSVSGAAGVSNTFIVPFTHDTYYYNGYQTVLINATPTGLSALKPNFFTGYKAQIFSGGALQTSGNSEKDFSGGRVQYTAAAENGVDLKNYFVAFVGKTDDAKLFVNGPLGNAEDGSNERYIVLDDYFKNRHDIFIANIGAQELTGLTATLEDAQNIALDDWYTLGGAGNSTLAAFTKIGSIGSSPNGIDSVAKVRIVPTGEGEIKGVLTITSANGGTVVINISGRAGNPRINTTQEQIDSYPAVKWVPYSFLVTTDNEYDWARASFRRSSGQLPPGLTLRSNGEIYGIPTVPGDYTFTVNVSFSSSGQYFPDNTKEFTITVKDNADEYVDSTVDTGYSILVRVPAVIGVTADQEFKVEGAFAEFIDFYLDGVMLVENTDYTVEDGSTKITIKSQTLTNASSGKHTIAAEFRVNGDQDSRMKRSAQNTTVTRGESYYSPSAPAPSPTGQKKTVTDIFGDLKAGGWYLDDIQWAYDHGYMIGTSETTFSPASKQTQATIFTVLARLADVNLFNYAGKTSPDIEAGQWYTNAAQWAKDIGLTLTDFDPDETVPRADMAVIIVSFLKWLEVDLTVNDDPVTITDAGLMTPDQLEAFTLLYKIGIFRGISDKEIIMNPEGSTTRAELSALLRRLDGSVN